MSRNSWKVSRKWERELRESKVRAAVLPRHPRMLAWWTMSLAFSGTVLGRIEEFRLIPKVCADDRWELVVAAGLQAGSMQRPNAIPKPDGRK